MNSVILQICVSLALGLLVGLQRERTEAAIAGIRTFPLMTLFGTVCALLSDQFGGWILATGLLALGALVITGNLAKQHGGDLDPGITTEIAAVLLFSVGALIHIDLSAGVIVAGIVVLLLHMKEQLHRMAKSFGERDVKAIMQFVLISLVILPILPNQEYGPYNVLNPFKIWLMVVLIVGLSLIGYVAFKLVGPRAGALIGGLLGGMISSTATTVSFARSSKAAPDTRPAIFATVILVASTVAFARVLVLIGATAAPQFSQLAPPLFAMLGVMVVIASVFWFTSRNEKASPPEPENPAELKPALIFGALYAGVLLAVEVASKWFGQAGVYVVSVISGLTDMDAITLSMSQLSSRGDVQPSTAWRAILLAAMANIVFKAGVVASLGTRALLWRIGLMFAAALVAGGAILVFWPW